MTRTKTTATSGRACHHAAEQVAHETGLKASTVKALRGELKDRGWLRAKPEKDETGAVVRWWVAITNAAPDEPRAGECNSPSLDYLGQKTDPEREKGSTREGLSGDAERAHRFDEMYPPRNT
jgi:hypothetical protein